MRSKTPPLRTITPDGKYASVVVARLINYVMKDGKQMPPEVRDMLSAVKLGKQVHPDQSSAVAPIP